MVLSLSYESFQSDSHLGAGWWPVAADRPWGSYNTSCLAAEWGKYKGKTYVGEAPQTDRETDLSWREVERREKGRNTG